jgi:DNA-binding beta-propeller fold protein YncE
MRNLSALNVLRATTVVLSFSLAAAASADTTWAPADASLPGSGRAGSRDVPVTAGQDTVIGLRNLPAGSTVTVLYGTEKLTSEPLTVGESGTLPVPLTVPADAARGLYPLTIVTTNPASVSQMILKVSDIVAPLNAEAFTLSKAAVGERAYQSAVSDDNKLYVASARGPNDGSKLLQLDPALMEITAEAELALDAKGEQIAVFALDVDNANGKIWTTNTKSDTVSVYNADDLSVAKVFPEGSVAHPRDVVVDEARSRAYVSAALGPFVEVYDTQTLEHVGQLQFVVKRGREAFGTMNMTLDAQSGHLYSVSRSTPWVGWIDPATGESTTVEVPSIIGATDIARDPETGRLFVVSQDSNNVVVLDAEGKLLADTYIGAGGVSVEWNAATSQAFAATRAGGTVAVLDVDGNMVSNLAVEQAPNHLEVGANGDVFVVSMYGERDDDSQIGSVTKITPAH